MEEARREVQRQSSDTIKDEVLTWSDEELATNLHAELLDILRQRDALRES